MIDKKLSHILDLRVAELLEKFDRHVDYSKGDLEKKKSAMDSDVSRYLMEENESLDPTGSVSYGGGSFGVDYSKLPYSSTTFQSLDDRVRNRDEALGVVAKYATVGSYVGASIGESGLVLSGHAHFGAWWNGPTLSGDYVWIGDYTGSPNPVWWLAGHVTDHDIHVSRRPDARGTFRNDFEHGAWEAGLQMGSHWIAPSAGEYNDRPVDLASGESWTNAHVLMMRSLTMMRPKAEWIGLREPPYTLSFTLWKPRFDPPEAPPYALWSTWGWSRRDLSVWFGRSPIETGGYSWYCTISDNLTYPSCSWWEYSPTSHAATALQDFVEPDIPIYIGWNQDGSSFTGMYAKPWNISAYEGTKIYIYVDRDGRMLTAREGATLGQQLEWRDEYVTPVFNGAFGGEAPHFNDPTGGFRALGQEMFIAAADTYAIADLSYGRWTKHALLHSKWGLFPMDAGMLSTYYAGARNVPLHASQHYANTTGQLELTYLADATNCWLSSGQCSALISTGVITTGMHEHSARAVTCTGAINSERDFQDHIQDATIHRPPTGSAWEAYAVNLANHDEHVIWGGWLRRAGVSGELNMGSMYTTTGSARTQETLNGWERRWTKVARSDHTHEMPTWDVRYVPRGPEGLGEIGLSDIFDMEYRFAYIRSGPMIGDVVAMGETAFVLGDIEPENIAKLHLPTIRGDAIIPTRNFTEDPSAEDWLIAAKLSVRRAPGAGTMLPVFRVSIGKAFGEITSCCGFGTAGSGDVLIGADSYVSGGATITGNVYGTSRYIKQPRVQMLAAVIAEAPFLTYWSPNNPGDLYPAMMPYYSNRKFVYWGKRYKLTELDEDYIDVQVPINPGLNEIVFMFALEPYSYYRHCPNRYHRYGDHHVGVQAWTHPISVALHRFSDVWGNDADGILDLFGSDPAWVFNGAPWDVYSHYIGVHRDLYGGYTDADFIGPDAYTPSTDGYNDDSVYWTGMGWSNYPAGFGKVLRGE